MPLNGLILICEDILHLNFNDVYVGGRMNSQYQDLEGKIQLLKMWMNFINFGALVYKEAKNISHANYFDISASQTTVQ